MTRMTRIFKAALYIPAYHTEGKKNPRHPCHPRLKDYLHAEGEPCSNATLVNYHLTVQQIYNNYGTIKKKHQYCICHHIGNHYISLSLGNVAHESSAPCAPRTDRNNRNPYQR